MRKTNDVTPLTPAVFYILLALMGSERHGYDIMGQVSEDSGGTVTMGPGTLYGSLDRMMESGFVERSPHSTQDPRRIYYRLTAQGKRVLAAEVDRLLLAAKVAQERKVKTA
ncbi:MAG: PadR family transcriptional regulator [Candidatus Pacebacteria bacterium]|nr:PadR family transcriptional regulator [Candidatus Paceibacterota bacterium]